MPDGFDIAQWGADRAADAFNTGMGMLLEGHNDRRQLRQQGKLQQQQIAGQIELNKANNAMQYDMWQKTGPVGQMEQLKAAGLNPALLYGKGGGGGQTIGMQSGSVGGGQAPSGGGETLAAIGMGMQQRMMDAQIKVMESQANKNNVEAEKAGGVDTENVKADTANKILQGVIHEYLGKEAAAEFNQVRQPNREIEADTYQTELESRKGIAGTIYELWTEGKLKEKSAAEIEDILLGNAKTKAETKQIYKTMELIEENIKGAKLDNIIKDLETKLQTETGIDRNSPTWMKVLGRLFVSLTQGRGTVLNTIMK